MKGGQNNVINFNAKKDEALGRVIKKKIENLKEDKRYQVEGGPIKAHFILKDNLAEVRNTKDILFIKSHFFEGVFLGIGKARSGENKRLIFKSKLGDKKGIYFIPIKNITLKNKFISCSEK